MGLEFVCVCVCVCVYVCVFVSVCIVWNGARFGEIDGGT
jgi:hypothetical protein